MSGNATFSYSDKSIDVNLTKFYYSWKLSTRSSSVSRLYQVVYPFRAVQSSLNVELQFNGPDEYMEFCDFARGYHVAVAKSSGRVGAGVPEMIFSSAYVPAMTSSLNGKGDAGGILYSVALPSISVSISNDMVAPTLSLELQILSGGDMEGGASSSYVSGGSLKDSMTLVRPKDVKSFGDDSFTRWKKKTSADADALASGVKAFVRVITGNGE